MASYKTTNTGTYVTLNEEKDQETPNENDNGNGKAKCGRIQVVAGVVVVLVITVVVATVFIVKALKSPTDNVPNDLTKVQDETTHRFVTNDLTKVQEETTHRTFYKGRPLIVEGKSRTTHSEAHNKLEKHDHIQLWKSREVPSVSPRNAHNQEIGRQWLRHAEAEHASIASFARHTLQLMALGAPSWLLIASQQASLDEIKHAEICYGFASAFLGSYLGPGTLNVQGSLQSVDVKEIVRSLIAEGCVGETLSAMEVHLAAKYATDTSVKAALEQIAADDTEHSQLAWDTLVWILEKFPEIQNFVEETFKDELEERLKPSRNESSFHTSVLCHESDKDSAFHNYGLLVKADRDKVQQVGIKDIIGPVYQAGFKNVKMISKLITEMDITVSIQGGESTRTSYCEG